MISMGIEKCELILVVDSLVVVVGHLLIHVYIVLKDHFRENLDQLNVKYVVLVLIQILKVLCIVKCVLLVMYHTLVILIVNHVQKVLIIQEVEDINVCLVPQVHTVI